MHKYSIYNCLLIKSCVEHFGNNGDKYKKLCVYLSESLNADAMSHTLASLCHAVERHILDFLQAESSEVYYNVIDMVVDECLDRIECGRSCAEVLETYVELLIRLDDISRTGNRK